MLNCSPVLRSPCCVLPHDTKSMIATNVCLVYFAMLTPMFMRGSYMKTWKPVAVT